MSTCALNHLWAVHLASLWFKLLSLGIAVHSTTVVHTQKHIHSHTQGLVRPGINMCPGWCNQKWTALSNVTQTTFKAGLGCMWRHSSSSVYANMSLATLNDFLLNWCPERTIFGSLWCNSLLPAEDAYKYTPDTLKKSCYLLSETLWEAL